MNEITLNQNDIPKKLFLILFYFFTMYVIGTLIAVVLMVSLRLTNPNNPNNLLFVSTLTNLLAYTLMFFVFLFVINDFYSKQIKAFSNKIVYFLFIAFIAWVFSYILNIVIEAIMELVKFVPRASENQDAIVESFKYPLLSIPMIIFAAPLVEETVFRGVIFNFVRNIKLPGKLNIILAFFLSSCLFGMIHVVPAFISSKDPTELVLGITYASTGFVLTAVYYYTKNIFASITMHFMQNCFATFVILVLPYLEKLMPNDSTPKIAYILAKMIHIF